MKLLNVFSVTRVLYDYKLVDALVIVHMTDNKTKTTQLTLWKAGSLLEGRELVGGPGNLLFWFST